MKKFLIVFLTLLILSGFIISCKKQTSSGKTIELRFMFWGDLQEIKIINDTIARFEKAYPRIKVKAERAPSGPPYMEKILTQIAGGNAPDVIFVSSDNIVTFGIKGLLMDLNPFVKKDKFPIQDYYQVLVKRFTYDGKLLVIPRDIAPVACLYYNKKMFDEAGLKYPTDNWTWKDLVRNAKKLTKKDKNTGRVLQFGLVEDWNLFDLYVLNNGGSYADNIQYPTKCTLDSPNAIYAIKFKRNLIYKWKVEPSPAQLSMMGGVGTSELFVSGKAAMFVSGIWKTPMFRQIKDFDWDIALFPKGPMAKKPGYPGGGSGYGIIKTTKYPEEAWKLVTYLAGEEGQIQLAKTGLAQPAIRRLAHSKYFLDDQKPHNKKILLKACNYVVFTPFSDKWNEMFYSYLLPQWDKIWLGKAKESEIANIIKKSVKEANKKYDLRVKKKK